MITQTETKPVLPPPKYLILNNIRPRGASLEKNANRTGRERIRIAFATAC